MKKSILDHKKELKPMVVAVFFFALCFVLLISFSTNFVFNGSISKIAEATPITTGVALLAATRNNSGNNFELENDVQINLSTSGLSVASSEIFSGTLDGKGHTVTINGSKRITESEKHVVAGVFSSAITGTIKNLNIVYNAKASVSTESRTITKKNVQTDGDTKSFIATFGILCGELRGQSAKVENVNLTIESDAAIFAIGNDTMGSKNGTEYLYLGGAGGIAGGLVGVMNNGSTIRNVTLNNKGVIYARADNDNVGETINWGNIGDQQAGVFDISSSTHTCRAVAGGLVGETKGQAVNRLENIKLDGEESGKVVAKLGKITTHFKTAYAGIILGQTNNESKVEINGLLYKSANVAATSFSAANKAGTWGGLVSTTSTLKNIFRNKNADDKSFKAAKGVLNSSADYDGTSLPGNSSIQVSSLVYMGSNTVLHNAWGEGVTVLPENIGNEIVNSTVIGGGGKVDYLGFTADGRIIMEAEKGGSYSGISAGGYREFIGTSTGPEQYISIYENSEPNQLNKVTFSFPKNSTAHKAYMYNTEMKSLEYGFGDYYSKNFIKTYDRAPVVFTGHMQGQSNTLLSSLKWKIHYTDPDGVPNNTYDTNGTPGNHIINSNSIVGVYSSKIYKTLLNPLTNQYEDEELQAGDFIGVDDINKPSKIYTYAGGDSPAKATINKIGVTISAGVIQFSKEYDGTSKVEGLIAGQHYVLGGVLDADKATTTISYDSANSFFADTVGNPSSTVSQNGQNDKKVILVGCGVNSINYEISGGTSLELLNCSIKPRVVTMEWQDEEGNSVPLGQEYNFQYIGATIIPSLVVKNKVFDSDEVNVSSRTFINDTTLNPMACIDVGEYNARPGTLSGANSNNYTMPSGDKLRVYYQNFSIIPKGLNIEWDTNTTFTFDKSTHTYSCVIENAATEVYARDNVTLSITYKNELNQVTTLRNAGEYTAFAEKSEDYGRSNYFILSNQTSMSNIVVNPWRIDVKYHTGTSPSIQPLPYLGIDYISSQNGLKVEVLTQNTELTSQFLTLSYKKDNLIVTKVITVGVYLAETAIINGTATEEQKFFNKNYEIRQETKTASFSIIPKEISLVYGEITFVYDATSKKDKVIVNIASGQIVAGDAVNVIKTWVNNETVTNVGTYSLNVSLTNPSYSIVIGDRARTITINSCSIENDNKYQIAEIPAQEYVFDDITPRPNVTYKGNTLTLNTDYDLLYANNKNAGEATIIVRGRGNFNGEKQVKFSINKKLLSVSFSITPNLVYSATSKNSDVKATLNGVMQGDTVPIVSYRFLDSALTQVSPVKAGNYSVIVSFPEINYKMPNEAQRRATFTILKKELGIVFSNFTGLSYINEELIIGTQFDPNKQLATGDNGNVEIAQEHMHNFDKSTNLVRVMRVYNAGFYKTTVALTGPSASNYVITSSNLPNTTPENCNVLEFSVSRRDLILNFSTEEVEYNKSPQGITFVAAQGYAPLGSDNLNQIIRLNYELENVSYTSVSNAGRYTVRSAVNNMNYKVKETNPNTVIFTINPKPIKLYLTYNGEALENNMEFTYGGVSHNIGGDITYHYRQGFEPITGDVPAVYKTLRRGTQTVEGAYSVSDDYKVVIDLSTSEKNYVLIKVPEPDEEVDSVLERFFKIKPRPIKISITNEDTIYDGLEGTNFSAVLHNQYGFVPEISTASGIVGDEIINLNASVISFQGVDNDGNPLQEELYELGERQTYRNRGTYIVQAYILGTSNYYIYTDANVHDTKTFTVSPYQINIIPKNITKIYGEQDKASDLTISATALGVDSPIVINLTRESGENKGVYYYNGFEYSGSSNYSISVNLNAIDEQGNVFQFEILERTHSITPREFEIQWDEWSEDNVPEAPSEEIMVVTPLFSVPITVVYTRTGAIKPDAGIYDLTGIAESNPNIKIEFSGVNNASGKNKYIVLGRPVSLQIKDFSKVYGSDEPDYYSPDNFKIKISDLPQIIQDSYNNDPDNYDWSNLIKCSREIGENYKVGGYIITYRFEGNEAKNYRLKLYEFNNETQEKQTARLMIEKYEVDFEDIEVTVVKHKTYNGHNRLDATNIKLTPASMDILRSKNRELFDRGFNVSAVFISNTQGEENSDAGDNKTIRVSFSVYTDYAINFILPNSFDFCNDGRIVQADMPVTLDVVRSLGNEELKITYGKSPKVVEFYDNSETTIQEGDENFVIYITYGKYNNNTYKFVGSDNPTTLNIGINAIYGDGTLVSMSNIKDVDNYIVRLSSAITNNYKLITYSESDPDSFTKLITITPKTISVEESGVIFKKPVDNSTVAPITRAHYKLVGILPRDEGLVDISYTALMNTINPEALNIKVNVRNVELKDSKATNYVLEINSFDISAKLLSLATIKMPEPSSNDFKNTTFFVQPKLVDYIEGAEVRINDIQVEQGIQNEELDGYGLIVNIKVFYEGLEGIHYPRTTESPINAGVYLVTSEIRNEATGYSKKGPDTILEIKKVKPQINIEGFLKQEYGQFSLLRASVRAAGLDASLNVKYSFENEDGTLPRFPNAGKHTVSVAYIPVPTIDNPNINYEGVSETKTLEISTKEVKVLFATQPLDSAGNPTDKFVYNGKNRLPELGISLQGIVEGDTCTPTLRISLNGQPTSNTEIKNAGNYFVSVGLSNNSYVIGGQSSVYINVYKAKLKVIPVLPSSTPAGQIPKYSLEYEGFYEGDTADGLTREPTLNLSSSKVGKNEAIASGGEDSNYQYEFVPTTYEVTYQVQQTKAYKNYIVYIVLSSMAGVAILIAIIALMSRRSILRSMLKPSNNRRKITKK